MILLTGRLSDMSLKHFGRRMTEHADAFKRATGENLFPGTVNIKIEHSLPINEHFRIKGTEIGEPDNDLLFEVCRFNGIWAYRIRPMDIRTGWGGHGDHIVEIACAEELKIRDDFKPDNVKLMFFR